ncbi:hypothetical protein CAI21_11360 [Alkalilimnicola ehrlichii]|uniref:Methyltransferase domain-containing protein n=1 Tax=Alkalilimnicola ehrlichii TaxID=351052 RepID=A0A3E0X2T2_9GAMM|nr:class I SAM-dependent methyltransferase [Alkalilimnicola ehrlichii]RFA29035.1 hypothetical protein CAI21_11360 [Alkalilimnicola ehrlichii]RFA38672.1 hypothetical protein CAL65_04915 [Alkalilimnicola ehrlichii]
MTAGKQSGWEAYYRAQQGRPVSPLLKQALQCYGRPGDKSLAIDLGCGAGKEVDYLLDGGWRVLAIDAEEQAIAGLTDRPEYGDRLDARCQRFESLSVLPTAALIHAGLSLPFCSPERFEQFWACVSSALEPGGIFAGHLFGDRDDWAGHPSMSFHSGSEVESMVSPFEIVLCQEREFDGKSFQGPKHWHRFDLVLRRGGGLC